MSRKKRMHTAATSSTTIWAHSAFSTASAEATACIWHEVGADDDGEGPGEGEGAENSGLERRSAFSSNKLHYSGATITNTDC
jgi:hypothetical protein